MSAIRALISDFKRLARGDFLAKHRAPVLLHQTSQCIDVQRDYRVNARRAAPRPTLESFDPRRELELLADASGLLVFRVQPKALDSDPHRITVGRTKDTDIQLPFDKVSVQHAFFTQAPGQPEWLLVDNHATNGTFVNGLRLAPHTPTVVRSGFVLKFGTAETVYYEPDGLYAYLSALMQLLGDGDLDP
jgi:hypothetical protein